MRPVNGSSPSSSHTLSLIGGDGSIGQVRLVKLLRVITLSSCLQIQCYDHNIPTFMAQGLACARALQEAAACHYEHGIYNDFYAQAEEWYVSAFICAASCGCRPLNQRDSPATCCSFAEDSGQKRELLKSVRSQQLGPFEVAGTPQH